MYYIFMFFFLKKEIVHNLQYLQLNSAQYMRTKSRTQYDCVEQMDFLIEILMSIVQCLRRAELAPHRAADTPHSGCTDAVIAFQLYIF
jgi:hypothetical protein